MSKFQIILLGVLVVAFLFAILLFSGIIPWSKGGGGKAVSLNVWGTFDEREMKELFSQLINKTGGRVYIEYVKKSPETYKYELLDAMAAGNPPDIWFMTQDMIIEFEDKVYKIPFESFSTRDFRDTFIDSGEIFIDQKENSVIAFPFFVDSIILYWNRSLFSSSGVARVPQYWDEFMITAESLTKRDKTNNITQSGAALGEFRNVRNAKEILSMMVLQTGNSIVRTNSLGQFEIVWNERGEFELSPAESALIYFGDFSNPKKTSYAWNRALDDSLHMFTSGSLAMYFSYSSEFLDVKQKNPHLDFDVAIVPQIKPKKEKTEIKSTFGKIYALAISKTSPKKQEALSAIFLMLNKDQNKQFAEALFLAPARRDLLAEGNPDDILSIFYKSAIMSRSWPEPNPQAVSEIFQILIESTVTGKVRIFDALSDAGKRLEELYK